jgi:effector-binding domain-containing protein
MAYDKVQFTYGMSIKKLEEFSGEKVDVPVNLEFALASIESTICSREKTGHAALQLVANLIENLNEEDADIIKKIINRDLKINLGRTQINKVWSGLITKPVYMRCGIFSDKTAKNISFPAIVQLKADGTYREFTVSSGEVTSRSRSGEEYDYPILFEAFKNYPDGIYTGELTIRGITDRAKGNGLINSDNPPHEDIIAQLWDYIPFEEYNLAGKKDKKNPCTITYMERWTALNAIEFTRGHPNIEMIPAYTVETLQDALKATSKWMNKGFEGAILKDASGTFKDGTSKHQLKLKLEISVEMRCTGFNEGTKGTKREGKVGSISFANDEGTIQGRCSGFTDKELDYFTDNQESLIGKIMEVQFNDLSKAENNDYYALSHPRFIEWRDDKDETDTLEKVKELRQMAMELK